MPFYLILFKINHRLTTSLSILLYLFISSNIQAHNPLDCPSISTTGPLSFTYGSYYGSSINNNFNDIKIDDNGNIFVFGSTISQGFDGILVKFDPSGTILWERLIGGSDADNNHPDNNLDYGKLTLDAAGNCYLTGITNSDNLTTLGAFQTTRAGGTDAYVAKYDPDGNLLFASYLGGSENENDLGAGDIAVDQDGNIFITGTTKSSNFFDTNISFQSTLSHVDTQDIFVVKISPDFSSLSGTYWGSQGVDVAFSIEATSDGTIWVGGYTENSTLNLPGQNPTANTGRDGLILAFNNDLSQVTGGTFFGGLFDDQINDLAIDDSNNIYVTGSSFSTSDFPILNAFQSTYQGGQMSFMAKLSGNGILEMSTFLGGSQNESGNSISVNDQNEIFITGTTSSNDFPFHRSVQETYNNWNCNYDGFIFKFNSDGTQDWGTPYGGWQGDDPKGIAVNSLGQVVVVGKTNSTDLPTSMGATQENPTFAGTNAFLSIFEIACPSIPIIIHSTENAIYYDQFWCSRSEIPSRHHFLADTCALLLIGPPGNTSYEWTRNGSSFGTGQIIPARNPGSSANTAYVLNIGDGNNCSDPSFSNPIKPDWVRPMCGFGSSFDENELPHTATILEGYTNEFYCLGDPINVELSADGFCGSTWQWQKNFMDIPNETTENFTVTEPGCYRIAITNSFTGCTVYSPAKQFILLDSIRLNNRQISENCPGETQVSGCSEVELQARISTCTGCYSAPSGLTYEYFLDGVSYRSSTSSRLDTSIPGEYQVRVMYNGCEIISNTTTVSIQPTEIPTWVLPSTLPACMANKDSLTFAISHPSANDSATINFNFPYPTSDLTSYDSLVTIQDLTEGCVYVNFTTKDGCTSRSATIELHDSLNNFIVELNGPSCIPVRLGVEDLSSCDLDSMFWYRNDSLVYERNYNTTYTARDPGEYFIKIKNGCGEFYSDTVFINGNLPTPNISPNVPVCSPANISLSFPNPDSSIVISWYRQTDPSGCDAYASNLIPNQNDANLVAVLPGYYFAVLQDTISGCKSLCTDKVEVQRSVAGAGILPSNNIYFCDGNGGNDQTFTVAPASPSFTYQWYRNGNPIMDETNASYTTDQQGVYRVYLENACDNSFTPTVSVFDIANPTVTIANPDTIYLCGPDTIRLSAESDQPILFQWFKDEVAIVDAIDSILLTTTAGKYQVFGKNNNSQCEDFSREIFIINSIPIAVNTTMNPVCNSPCTGSITANVSGGVPFSGGTYQYQWSNGANTKTINNLCVGNYQLTITDKVGCNTYFSTSVTSGFSINPTIDSIHCFGINDGSIAINPQGGIPPFSYNWNTGANTSSIIDLSPGNYQVTITDGSSCSSVSNYTLSPPVPLNLLLTPKNASCFNTNDGNIQAISSGGKLPHTLTWDAAVHADSMNLSAGWYRVSMTDANNCELIDSVFISEPLELEVSLQISNLLDCSGSTDGAITSAVSGSTGPYTYLWNEGSTSTDLNNLSADTFSVTVTDQQNCQASADIILAAPEDFTIIIDEQENIHCNAAATGSFQVLVQGGSSPIQFFLDGLSINESDLDNLLAGDYEIYAEDANNCKTTTLTVNLTEPAPIFTTVMTDSVSCFGTSTGSVSINSIGGIGSYTYEWSNGLTVPSTNSLSAGNYSVTISDSLFCEEIVSFSILEPLPMSTNFIREHVYCNGGNNGSLNNIISSGGTPPYTYFLEGNNLPSLHQNFDSLEAGTYILITQDANNCETRDTTIITEPEVISTNIQIVDSLLCFGASNGKLESITTGGSTPYQWLWENGNTSFTNDNLTTGTYKITITDSLGCTIDNEIYLPDGPFLDITISNQKNLSCLGSDDGSITVEANGGTAPLRYFIEQDSSDIGVFENLPAGNYAIYVKDQNNCISDTRRVEIISPNELIATVNTNPVICPDGISGQAFIITSGGTEPYSYNWNNGLNAVSSTNLRAGNYQVTITDAQNCETNISFTISEPNPIVHELEIQPTNCYEGRDGSFLINGTLGGTAPYQYFFNDSLLLSGDIFIDSLPSGTYDLKTIDQNGCGHIESILIQEPAQLKVDLGADQTLVLGQSSSLPINVLGGYDTLRYLISPNTYLDCFQVVYYDCAEPTIIQPIEDIKYEITLIDGHECIANDEVLITVLPADHFIYMANAFNPYSVNGNETFFVQATPAVERIKTFKIFNRWGATVFNQKDFLPNDKSYGWKGDFKNQMVNTGVYIYQVIFETIDGIEMQQMGDVTVAK